MKKGFNRSFIHSIFSFFFILSSVQGQQLLQSFSEQNEYGNSKFGNSVSDAGDLNGDGFEDIVVGAPAAETDAGRAYVFFGSENMDESPDLILTGNSPFDRFGTSVSGAGDLNNDGFDDLIIGAPNNYVGFGSVYLYYGGAEMDSIPDLILDGGGQSHFGISVSGAGDINNDGYADIIVGAQLSTLAGSANIYFGGAGMDSIPDISLASRRGQWSYFGKSVSGAGDINNDGYSDILVGSVGYVYVFFGSDQTDLNELILSGAPNSSFGADVSDAGDINGDGFDDIIIGGGQSANILFGSADFDGSNKISLSGEADSDFGSSVSGAGDVNKDGFADVIIGAYYQSTRTGSAFIYNGGANMDSTADVVMSGEYEHGEFGRSVSGGADLNKDGYDDVLAGAPGYRQKTGTGNTYIFFGSEFMDGSADLNLPGELEGAGFGRYVSNAGDVNNDGFNDILINSSLGNLLYLGSYNINNNADAVYPGGYSSGGGDFNNDGFDDLLFPGYSREYEQVLTYVYFGSANPDTIADLILAAQFYSGSMSSIASAGDLNNDGYDDIIFGAPEILGMGRYIYYGEVYVHLGSAQMDSIPDLVLSDNGMNSYFGNSIDGAGDLNNDGFDDIIIGRSKGDVYIYYGAADINNMDSRYLQGDSFGPASGAGDVNNDGFDDVIIGAPKKGTAYIFFGGDDMDNNADVILGGNNLEDKFGHVVKEAGDINHDGFDDVIVGAPDYDNLRGKVLVYYGGANMNKTADLVFTGNERGEQLGFSAAGTGDVNKDGYDDFLIGAPEFSINGAAWLYSHNLAPVPVELLSFSGVVTDGFIFLKWRTATETNNYGFEVERRPEEGKWQTIGFVKGSGSTTSIKDYSFVDKLLTNDSTYFYRIKQVDLDGTYSCTHEIEVTFEVIKTFALEQNYPNPFNQNTIIKYSIPFNCRVKIEIYNSLGQQQSEILNDYLAPGLYESAWRADNLASGVYLCSISAVVNSGEEVFNKTIKLLLLK